MKKWAFLTGMALMLSACGSTAEPTRYYQLPDSAFRLPENAVLHNEIAVQIVLPQHLNGNSLLYQPDDFQLNFSQKNLWAAPLNETLSASLSNKLNAETTHSAFVPQKLAKNPKRSLKIYIDRFQGTHHGYTEISGYGQWDNGTSQAFNVRTPQIGDGYTAMIDSLNKGLGEVAKKLAH